MIVALENPMSWLLMTEFPSITASGYWLIPLNSVQAVTTSHPWTWLLIQGFKALS